MADDKKQEESKYDQDSEGRSLLEGSLDDFIEKPAEPAAEPEKKPEEPAAEPEAAVDARKPEQAEPSKPAVRGFDEGHFGIGRQFGLTPDQLRQQFGTPEAFERAVANYISAPKPEEKKPEPEEELPEFEFKVENEEDLAPELVSAMKSITSKFNETHKAMAGKIKSLESQLKATNESNQYQQAQAAVTEFDNVISGLGDDWEPIFGKGASTQMDQSSDAARNRQRLAETAAALRTAYQSLPTPRSLSLREAMSLALKASFDKPETKPSGPSEQQIDSARKRNGSIVDRAPVREKPALVGIDQAAANIDRFKSEHGLMEDSDEL